ncbi:MAG: polysaccharide deacetylase family protein [Chitinophagaceae bacterium]
MKNILTGLCFLFVCNNVLLAQQTIQEKLGYPKDAKLLIIHGDDLGVSHSENEATEEAMEKGSVRSASIMVPTPWLSEIAAYARTHPTADFGLHLTLTSEWSYYKWGPVAGKSVVPGLVNQHGYFYSSVDSLDKTATVAEVETELRAQIEKAKGLGIDVTHLDSHMGALFNKKEFRDVYIKLGREYKIPVFIDKEFGLAFGMDSATYSGANEVKVDRVFTINPGDYIKGSAAYYTKTLHTIPPGLNLFIIHVAYNDKEMQSITVDHPDWGAAWRQADHDFFTTDVCRKILRDEHIQVVTWREIRDKLYR